MEELKCIECGNTIPISTHYSVRKFCSKFCAGRNRRSRPGYKEQITRLMKEWEIKNKEKRLAYCREWEKKNYPKRKLKNLRWKEKNPDYFTKYNSRPNAIIYRLKYRNSPRGREVMRKAKERFNVKHPNYWKQIFNQEKHRNQVKRYRKSDKGKATGYNIYDRKRRRNMLYLGKKIDWPTTELITMLRERDKVCFYCRTQFDYEDSNSLLYPTFDHINPELPLNEINAVVACRRCNSSKNDTEVLSWLKEKKLEPSPVLLEMLKKQQNI